MLPGRVTVQWLRRAGGGAAREGWLAKEGRQLKNWKQRYFVLWPRTAHPSLGRLLCYFTSDGSSDGIDTGNPTCAHSFCR